MTHVRDLISLSCSENPKQFFFIKTLLSSYVKEEKIKHFLSVNKRFLVLNCANSRHIVLIRLWIHFTLDRETTRSKHRFTWKFRSLLKGRPHAELNNLRSFLFENREVLTAYMWRVAVVSMNCVAISSNREREQP